MSKQTAGRRQALAGYDGLTIFSLTALLIIAFATVGDYAVSNDEPVQQRYGERIIAYYASGLADRALFELYNLYLYGGLFDVAATLLHRLLPFDLYLLRHGLSALAGIACIAATAATARLVGSPRAGFLAAVALAVSGVWYGAMFNHTKDVPFAAAMMGATFFLLRLARDLPRPRRRDVLGFGMLMGAALGLRALGLLLPAYAGFAVLLQAFLLHGTPWPQRLRFMALSTFRLLPALAIAYVVMAIAWPWATLDPLNPFRAIQIFAGFDYKIKTMLTGEVYLMNDVPRWYVPTYLLVKLPLIVLAGALFALGAAAMPTHLGGDIRPRPRRETMLIAFIALYPVLCTVAMRGPGFTGMRHVLYVVPPLAVLAGLGFDSFVHALTRLRPAVGAAALAALVAGLAWLGVQLVQLHPHQYLYFNAIAGGLDGASRRYDTDYWLNAMPEAVARLHDYVRRTDGGAARRYSVAVCGERLAFEHAARGRFDWTGDWLGADFFIAPTHMDCDRVMRGKIAFAIERLGVVIGVVQDMRGLGPDERDFIERRPRRQ